jgi:hypothetical protein
MSISIKQYNELREQFAVLEAQLKGKTPEESASSSRGAHRAEPKLRTFRGTKYTDRKDEFETFALRYEAEKDLNAGSFTGWMEAQAIAFLTTALEEEALQVIRAYLTMHVEATHVGVWTDLAAAFRDTKQGERALVKLQGLVQKGELDDYVREFNLLQGLASKVVIIDKEVLLQYFVQGLHLNIRIGLAAALPDNLQAARTINLFIVGKKDNLQEQKPEPMDTTSGQSTEHCNWCNFSGHFERECYIKAKRLPKKDYTQEG